MHDVYYVIILTEYMVIEKFVSNSSQLQVLLDMLPGAKRLPTGKNIQRDLVIRNHNQVRKQFEEVI